MTRKPATVSRRAFARKMGAPASTIDRMATDGRLPTDASGKLPLKAATAAWAKIQEERTEAAEARRGEAAALRDRLQVALAREREAKARLREIELQIQEGRFVAVAEVRADIGEQMEIIRAQFLTLAGRTALQLEAACALASPRAPVIAAIVDNEVNRILTALYYARFDVGPNGKTYTCGLCVERERSEAEEARERAELDAGGVTEWKAGLRAALEHCLRERPRAGDEIPPGVGLPLELQRGIGAAPLFLRNVATAAYHERLAREHGEHRDQTEKP